VLKFAPRDAAPVPGSATSDLKNCGPGTVVRGKYRVLSPSRGSFSLRKEPYLMKVFVLSQEGKPLMPTTPRRARVWLKAKRARLVRQEPFTIRLRFATKAHVQAVFGESQVSITYGYETTYKRLQVLDLPKSHTNDAVAIACEISEVVKPLKMVIRSAV